MDRAHLEGAEAVRIGFMWSCPWRLGRSEHEYWTRYQFGPFYLLKFRRGDD
jgi:hypothetical protein